MKSITGIILLGGSGNRLRPLTNYVNKHLLPVYNAPMVLHTVRFLIASEITNIVLSVNPEDQELLEREIPKAVPNGVNVRLVTQDEIKGTAHALELCEPLIDTPFVATLFGDTLYEYAMNRNVEAFVNGHYGACIHTTEVSNPQEFAGVELLNGNIVSIEDKPQEPKSSLIMTGFMLFRTSILFSKIKRVRIDRFGEFNMMGILPDMILDGILEYYRIKGWWIDAGTSINNLHEASILVKEYGINKYE